MKYTKKRRCGRMLPFGAVLAAALLLSGCNALPEPVAAQGGEVVQLTGGTAQGCYVQGSGPEGGGDPLAFWVDYGTRSITCLCAQPNCDHTGDGCTARGGLPVVLPDGRLVWKDSRLEPDGQVSTALWLSQADGSGRRLLAERQPGTLLPRFADDTSLYYAVLAPDGMVPGRLCRVPLDGGDPVTALELRNPGDGTGYETILGVEGRCLVTEYVDLSSVQAVPQPDPLTDDPQAEEEYRAALEQIVTPRQIWLTDLDTGEQNLLFQWGVHRRGAGLVRLLGAGNPVPGAGGRRRAAHGPAGRLGERAGDLLAGEPGRPGTGCGGGGDPPGGRTAAADLLPAAGAGPRLRWTPPPANADEIRLQTAYQGGRKPSHADRRVQRRLSADAGGGADGDGALPGGGRQPAADRGACFPLRAAAGGGFSGLRAGLGSPWRERAGI